MNVKICIMNLIDVKLNGWRIEGMLGENSQNYVYVWICHHEILYSITSMYFKTCETILNKN